MRSLIVIISGQLLKLFVEVVGRESGEWGGGVEVTDPSPF
jgi:hypothetical protein